MEKIKMPHPIAELDGDEMTHVLWGKIKEQLILPFVELNTEYYDLGLPNRERTADQVTRDAAEAIRRLHIGVKCATITPNLQRQEEYGLSQLWKSPNATIRAALDGTVFRAPILISRVKPVVTSWKKPVTIARHAYGDLYKAVEYRVPGKGKAELVFTDENGVETSRQTVYQFSGPGVVQAMHNRDDSILSFARCCFSYGLSVRQNVWFSSKDTISKDYDQTFKLLFQKVYDEEYRTAFEKAGLTYRYALIDDVAAKVIRSPAGSLFHLPVLAMSTDEFFTWTGDHNMDVWAADVYGTEERKPESLPAVLADKAAVEAPKAVLFGNEARGLEPDILTRCGRIVSIPLYGKAESLNLGTSAAVMLMSLSMSGHVERM